MTIFGVKIRSNNKFISNFTPPSKNGYFEKLKKIEIFVES